MSDGAERQLPQYQCHKKVSALKIAELRPVVGGSAILTPADAGYVRFEVDQEYVAKHKPQVGGYYVVYEDGYRSYSPAKAFEEGYTRI